MTDPTPLDSLWRAFRKLVRAELPTLSFLGMYEYTVYSTSGGRLSAKKVNPEISIPDVVQIQIRTGIPGATVTPANGSTIYIFFADGDPSKPRVALYDSTDATVVQLNASGASASARQGDSVNAGYVVIKTVPPGTILTPGGYFPGTPTGLAAASAAAAALTPPGSVLSLDQGRITSGSSTVTVGS